MYLKYILDQTVAAAKSATVICPLAGVGRDDERPLLETSKFCLYISGSCMDILHTAALWQDTILIL
jgi:hypothetical protein